MHTPSRTWLPWVITFIAFLTCAWSVLVTVAAKNSYLSDIGEAYHHGQKGQQCYCSHYVGRPHEKALCLRVLNEREPNIGRHGTYKEEAGLGVKWGTIADWAMTVFTAVLLLVAYYQWKTSRSQMETQRAELRAYVSFSINRNPDNDPFAGVPYRLKFNCENHGKTPAIEVGFVGRISLVGFDESGNYRVPEIGEKIDRARGNLFPGEKMSDKGLGIDANTKEVFTAAQIASVESGSSAYIVGLRIRYADVFGVSHETIENWMIYYEKIQNGMRRRVTLIPGASLIT
jgi:hypothetical protein